MGASKNCLIETVFAQKNHWDGSFEYPQHMFWLRNKMINFLVLKACDRLNKQQDKFDEFISPDEELFEWNM